MSELDEDAGLTQPVRITARHPSWECVVSVPLGFLLVSMAVYSAVVDFSIYELVVTAITFAFGLSSLISCAYQVWGTCTMSSELDFWVLEKQLWRWKRVTRFAHNRVQTASVDVVPRRRTIGWPSLGGRYLRVELYGSKRPIFIGRGLYPSKETLDDIWKAVCPPAYLIETIVRRSGAHR